MEGKRQALPEGIGDGEWVARRGGLFLPRLASFLLSCYHQQIPANSCNRQQSSGAHQPPHPQDLVLIHWPGASKVRFDEPCCSQGRCCRARESAGVPRMGGHNACRQLLLLMLPPVWPALLQVDVASPRNAELRLETWRVLESYYRWEVGRPSTLFQAEPWPWCCSTQDACPASRQTQFPCPPC